MNEKTIPFYTPYIEYLKLLQFGSGIDYGIDLRREAGTEYANLLGRPDLYNPLYLTTTTPEQDFSLRRATLGIITGFLEGFTTLPLQEWLDTKPRNTFEGLTTSIGHLLGFLGILPGPGLAAKLGLTSVLKGMGLYKKGIEYANLAAKGLPATLRVKSVPILLADKIIEKATTSPALKTLFAKQEFLQSPTLRHLLRSTAHLGIASAIGSAPIYDLSWATLVDRRLEGFLHGGLYGLVNSGLGELISRGGKLDIGKRLYPELEQSLGELRKTNLLKYNEAIQQIDRANNIARAITSSLFFGGMSTLRGDPLPFQVYEYVLNAYFGAKEIPYSMRVAKAIISKYDRTGLSRIALLSPEKLPEWESLNDEIKEELRVMSDIMFGKYFGGENQANVVLVKSIIEANKLNNKAWDTQTLEEKVASIREAIKKQQIGIEQGIDAILALNLDDKVKVKFEEKAQKIMQEKSKQTQEPETFTVDPDNIPEKVYEEIYNEVKSDLADTYAKLLYEEKLKQTHEDLFKRLFTLGGPENETDKQRILNMVTDLDQYYTQKAVSKSWIKPFSEFSSNIIKTVLFKGNIPDEFQTIATEYSLNLEKKLIDLMVDFIGREKVDTFEEFLEKFRIAYKEVTNNEFVLPTDISSEEGKKINESVYEVKRLFERMRQSVPRPVVAYSLEQNKVVPYVVNKYTEKTYTLEPISELDKLFQFSPVKYEYTIPQFEEPALKPTNTLQEIELEIYTDGSHIKGTEQAGTGVYFVYKDKEFRKSTVTNLKAYKEKYNLEGIPSNPTTELEGVISALQEFIDKPIKGKLTIYSDYEGVQKWYYGEWKIKLPHIQQLVSEIKNLVNKLEQQGLKIEFKWIRGHAGNVGNEKVDKIAKDTNAYNEIPEFFKLLNVSGSSSTITPQLLYRTNLTQWTDKVDLLNIDIQNYKPSEVQVLRLPIDEAQKYYNPDTNRYDVPEDIAQKFELKQTPITYNLDNVFTHSKFQDFQYIITPQGQTYTIDEIYHFLTDIEHQQIPFVLRGFLGLPSNKDIKKALDALRAQFKNNPEELQKAKERYYQSLTSKALVQLIENIYTSHKEHPIMVYAGHKDKGRIIISEDALIDKEQALKFIQILTTKAKTNEALKQLYAEYQTGLQDWVQAGGQADIYTHLFANNLALIKRFNFPHLPIFSAYEKLISKEGDFILKPTSFIQRIQVLYDHSLRPNTTELAQKLERNTLRFIILNANNSDGSPNYSNPDIEDNSYRLRSIESEHKLVAQRDGGAFISRRLFDALMNSVGLPTDGGQFKGVHVFHGGVSEAKGLGGFIGKLAFHVADPVLDKAMEQMGVDIIHFDTTAKQKGLRKSYDWYWDIEKETLVIKNEQPEIYEAPLDSITIRDIEHLDKLRNNEPVTLAKQIGMNIFDFLSGGKEAKQALYEKYFADSIVRIQNAFNILIKYEYKSPEFQRVIKEILQSDYEQEYNLHDNVYSTEFEQYAIRNAEYENIAQRIVSLFPDITPAILQFPGVKEYFNIKLKNWIAKQVVSPKIHNAWHAVAEPHNPALIASIGGLKEGEFVLGNDARNIKLKMPIKIDDKEIMFEGTLGTLYDTYSKTHPEIFDFLVIRTPADSPASVRTLRFKGFVNKRGAGIMLHPLEMIHLGGMDTDWDKTFIYFDMPDAVKQYFKKHKDLFFTTITDENGAHKVFRSQKTLRSFLRPQDTLKKLIPNDPLSLIFVHKDAVMGNSTLGPALTLGNRLKELYSDSLNNNLQTSYYLLDKKSKRYTKVTIKFKENVQSFLDHIVDAVNFAADAIKGYPLRTVNEIRELITKSIIDNIQIEELPVAMKKVTQPSVTTNIKHVNTNFYYYIQRHPKYSEMSYIDGVMRGDWAASDNIVKILNAKYDYNLLFYNNFKKISDAGLFDTISGIFHNWVGSNYKIFTEQFHSLFRKVRTQGKNGQQVLIPSAQAQKLMEELSQEFNVPRHLVRYLFENLHIAVPYAEHNEVFGKELLRNDLLDITSVIHAINRIGYIYRTEIAKGKDVLSPKDIQTKITKNIRNIFRNINQLKEEYNKMFRKVSDSALYAEMREKLIATANTQREAITETHWRDLYDTLLIATLKPKKQNFSSFMRPYMDPLMKDVNEFIRTAKALVPNYELPQQYDKYTMNFYEDMVWQLVRHVQELEQKGQVKRGLTTYFVSMGEYILEGQLRRDKAIKAFFDTANYNLFLPIVSPRVLRSQLEIFQGVIDATFNPELLHFRLKGAPSNEIEYFGGTKEVFSGSAIGADSMWEILADKFGFKVRAYSFVDHEFSGKQSNRVILSVNRLKQALPHVLHVARVKKRKVLAGIDLTKKEFTTEDILRQLEEKIKEPPRIEVKRNDKGEVVSRSYSDSYVLRLLARNYYQIANADKVFAIVRAKLDDKGNIHAADIQGGTSWAIHMMLARIENLPAGQKVPQMYIYNVGNNMWYYYSYGSRLFEPVKSPKDLYISDKSALIGTREVGDVKKIFQVMQDVFLNTVRKSSVLYDIIPRTEIMSYFTQKILPKDDIQLLVYKNKITPEISELFTKHPSKIVIYSPDKRLPRNVKYVILDNTPEKIIRTLAQMPYQKVVENLAKLDESVKINNATEKIFENINLLKEPKEEVIKRIKAQLEKKRRKDEIENKQKEQEEKQKKEINENLTEIGIKEFSEEKPKIEEPKILSDEEINKRLDDIIKKIINNEPLTIAEKEFAQEHFEGLNKRLQDNVPELPFLTEKYLELHNKHLDLYTDEAKEYNNKLRKLLATYPHLTDKLEGLWTAYLTDKGEVPYPITLATEKEIYSFIDSLEMLRNKGGLELKKRHWFFPTESLANLHTKYDKTFYRNKVAYYTPDGIIEFDVEMPTSRMNILYNIGTYTKENFDGQVAKIKQYFKNWNTKIILDSLPKDAAEKLWNFAFVAVEKDYVLSLSQTDDYYINYMEMLNRVEKEVTPYLSKTYKVTGLKGTVKEYTGHELVQYFMNTNRKLMNNAYHTLLTNSQVETQFKKDYLIPNTPWIDFNKLGNDWITKVLNRQSISASIRLLDWILKQYIVQTRTYFYYRDGKQYEVRPIDIENPIERAQMLSYLANLRISQIHSESATIEETYRFPFLYRAQEMWAGKDPLFVNNYMPHMDHNPMALEKYFYKVLEKLQQNLQEGKISEEVYKTERLRYQLKLQRLTGQQLVDYQENTVEEFLEVLGSREYSPESISKVVDRDPAPLMARSEAIPEWSTKYEVLEKYFTSLQKNIHDMLFAFLSHYNSELFSKEVNTGISTGQGINVIGKENAKAWRFFMDTYIRDILGYPAIFSEEIVNDPYYKIKGNPYYWITEDYWIRKRGPMIDKFFNVSNDMPEPLRRDMISRKLISLSILEGKMALVTLLSSPKTYLVNRLTGTINTLISAGYEPYRKAKSIEYLRKINPQWKTMEDVYKDLEKLGAIESFILSEISVGQKFSEINIDSIKERIIEIYNNTKSKEQFIKYATTFLKQEGLIDAITDLGAVFMRLSEIKNRREAFLAHYIKAREVFEAANHTYKWDDPWLIRMAQRGVKASQFLYDNIHRPAFARTALGKMVTRFQLFTLNSILFRKNIYTQFRDSGFNENSEEYRKFSALMAMDILVFALGSLLPYSLFNATLPPPWNYLQDLSEWLFGEEKEKEKAFYGVLPYPMNILQPALPPVTRYATGLFNALVFNQFDKFVSYQLWTWFPFGRMANDIRRTIDNPYMVIDKVFGIPLIELTRKISASKEQSISEDAAELTNK